LNLTQSAISQQIRSLETYLEQPLFHRSGRSVSLTDAGHDLLSTTQSLLQHLAVGIRRLDQYRKPNQLVVNTSPAFARHWLLPRLADFHQRCPQVDLWLFTSFEVPDMATETIDLAIRDDSVPRLSAASACCIRTSCTRPAILPWRLQPRAPPCMASGRWTGAIGRWKAARMLGSRARG
jgi:LysR family glycine cleavage system transcriptional activator